MTAFGMRGRATGLRRWASALAMAGLWLGCSPDPLPVLDAVPDFTLTERAGTPVRASELDGTVWIANFVFTSCPDVCPALSQQMKRLATTIGAAPGTVRYVSVSVDPTRDTPAALTAYAEKLGAGPDWWFLTGSRTEIATLLKDGFRLAWADDGPPTAPITHSDRFVLVDRQRRIRGYYHGGDAADVERLGRDAARLVQAAETP